MLDDPRPSAVRLEGLLPAEDYSSLKKYKERMERWFHKGHRPPTPPPEPAQARRVITVHTGGDLALKFTMPPSQQYTVAQLLQDVCFVLGVRHQDFVLQLKFSRALSPEQNVEDALIESALLGNKAGKQTLDPKQLFQLFDKDNSGEIDLVRVPATLRAATAAAIPCALPPPPAARVCGDVHVHEPRRPGGAHFSPLQPRRHRRRWSDRL